MDHGVSADSAAVVVTENALPSDLIVWLNRYADANTDLRGRIENTKKEETYEAQVRRSDIAWLLPAENAALLEALSSLVRRVNADSFGLELVGFSEKLQVATYNSEELGFYDWHLDIGTHERANRKLSLVAPLLDQNSYEGGDLQLMLGPEPMTVDMPLGCVVAFPSYVLHRVTPVTKGIRRSLVVWISGPRFR